MIEMTKVDIPDSLYEVLSKRAEEKNFDSCEDYIVDILEQVSRKLKRMKKEEGKKTFSKEEEEKVKERLRGLGYLD